jgi:hypothetical protein
MNCEFNKSFSFYCVIDEGQWNCFCVGLVGNELQKNLWSCSTSETYNSSTKMNTSTTTTTNLNNDNNETKTTTTITSTFATITANTKKLHLNVV